MTSRSKLLTVVATLMTTSGCGAPAIPDGWITIPRLTEDEMSCANYEGGWAVSVVGSMPRITPSEPEPRAESERESLDIDDIRDPESDPRVDHVVALNEGWFVGIERGDQGSGVWWIGRGDTSDRSVLYEGNVVGLERFSDGVLLFVGLSHLTIDRGSILHATRSQDGRWSAEDVADLGSMPLAFAAESPSTVIVLDGNGLRRVHIDSGRIEGLVEIGLGVLYPTSMVITRSGFVYVGMRHAVARFDLTTDPPTQDWHVRPECPHLRRLSDWECYCVGGTTTEDPTAQ